MALRAKTGARGALLGHRIVGFLALKSSPKVFRSSFRCSSRLIHLHIQLDSGSLSTSTSAPELQKEKKVLPNGRPLASSETPYVRRKVIDQQEGI